MATPKICMATSRDRREDQREARTTCRRRSRQQGEEEFGGRPPRTNRRDGGGFHRQHGDDGEGEIRQPEESRREETNTTTLAQVLERLERLEKFDSAREDPDRRGGNLGSSWSRGAVNPPEYDDEDDWGFDETRRMRNGGTFVRGKNPNWGLREGQPDTRLRRDQWGRHARIRFHIKECVWEVVEFNDVNNHPFVEDNQKHLIRSCRKITETKGSILNTMVDSEIKPTKAYSYLTNEVGGAQNVGFTLQDLFDTTYRTNKYNMTFMEAMRNKAPKTIFTDQDSAMANAIGKAKFNKMLCEVEMENEMAQLWRDLCEGWNVAENKWLSNMYLIRHKCYYEKQAEKMRENQAPMISNVLEGCQELVWIVHEGGIYTYTLMREFGPLEHYVSFNSNNTTISCTCKLFDLLEWLRCHALTVMNNHLNVTTIPMQYILKRWTKSARLKVQNDDSGSCSLDLTSTRTYHLKELMRQSFDVMSLSVHDVETVKIAKKRLHELDVEIRNYVSSSDNNTKRTEDNDVPQVSPTQILDPLKKKSKGMTNSRMKSGIEKRKKGKSLKGKGPLQQFHGVNPTNNYQCGIGIFT
ncbi:hypothetical protein SASPL_148291 [Salvia splendens]|uniref:Protein FAR1-RELATED SEQUENCE n=1 Tax=Salvia splendens TaxID=180675 RepID=A0A8X8Z3Z1_SALSN|nr:hypothetical protein SASPL_148291 [Salvia splendens]